MRYIPVIVMFTFFSYTGQINIQKSFPKEENVFNSTEEKGNRGIQNKNKIPRIDFNMQESKLNSSLISNVSYNNSATVNITFTTTKSPSVPDLPKINETLEEKTNEIESGAITRGIMVFVGISFLFIFYVGIKTCRRKKQDKSRTIIKKYGVRTNRADLEMEPLPLTDDDEDETVFDLTASRVLSNNA